MENHHLYGESSCLWDVYDHLYHIYISSFHFGPWRPLASSLHPVFSMGHPQLLQVIGETNGDEGPGGVQKKGDRIVR